MPKHLLTVEDYRLLAKKRLPKVAFEFVDGAAESELTMRENLAAFNQVALRPKNGTQVGIPNLRTSVLGTEISMPVIVAPCGMARVVHPDGDLAAARAAGKAGTIFTLSTMAGHSMEEIADNASGPLWYQVYNVGGRDRVEGAIDRATKAGYLALVVTVDTQVSAGRHRDARNGVVSLLAKNKLKALPYTAQLLRKPGWLLRRMGDGLIPRVPNVLQADGTPEYLWKNVRPYSLTFEDLAWIRERWHGSILVKGVLTGSDTRRAIDAGVDGVIISNHGGRQLDSAEATLRVLPEIAAAADGRCTVLLDGGIRRGNDVIKALCLGATAVLIGRPWMYALSAAGQAGIEGVLDIFRRDLVRDMQLLGSADVADLNPEFVRAPAEWFAG